MQTFLEDYPRIPKELQQDFREDYYERFSNASRSALALGLILYAVFGILDIWGVPESKDRIWAIRFFIVCPVIFACFMASLVLRLKGILQLVTTIASVTSGFGIIGMMAAAKQTEPGYAFYYAGLIIVIMMTDAFARLQLRYAATSNVIVALCYEAVAVFYQRVLTSASGLYIFINNNFFLLACNIIGLTTCYYLEVYSKRDFLQRRALHIERAKSEKLLLNVLPVEIAARLREKAGTIADTLDSVSVLFADIVGFTPMSSQMGANRLVEVLNALFCKFDDFVEEAGLEKIKTIGDCYMVASGVPAVRRDHAQALARVGLNMLAYVAAHEFPYGRQLGLRVGISSGSVVAGVIGTRKFSYDLWGETVNIASRMESDGTPGKVQISRATYELIKDDFVCEARGEILVKGKGNLEVWYLISERPR